MRYPVNATGNMNNPRAGIKFEIERKIRKSKPFVVSVEKIQHSPAHHKLPQ
jgi:hypothetical protein